MRFVSFIQDGKSCLGVVNDDMVLNLSLAAPDLPQDLLSLLQAGDDAMAKVAQVAENAQNSDMLELDGLEYDLPIKGSGKIICLGLNYAKHAAEGGFEPPDFPIVFLRTPTSLVAHGHDMLKPIASDTFDYEAELVAVIGKTAHHVSTEDALDYVAGYSCFNDGSIREYQRWTSQWTLGKNFDKTGGFGPVFVTADELPPGCKGLKLESRLNGRVMQSANTDHMIFPVAETINILSRCMTLEPGDVLVTGTCEGVGFARNPPVWMKQGDTIEIEIEGIGTLVNPIADEV